MFGAIQTFRIKSECLSAEAGTVPTEGNLDSEVWQHCALPIAVHKPKIYRTVVYMAVESELSPVGKDMA
jgi:hypothetical protein